LKLSPSLFLGQFFFSVSDLALQAHGFWDSYPLAVVALGIFTRLAKESKTVSLLG
jgi:hypothetical protein